MLPLTPGGEEGEITIGDMTTDQQTACPKTLICAAKFFDLEIGQFEIAPIHAAAVLVPAPADRRFQSDERRVRAMSAALPATDRRLPAE